MSVGLVQDGSEGASDSESDSETPAPEALARYLAIRRYTATGGAGLAPAAAVGTSSSGVMKSSHGTAVGFSPLHVHVLPFD